MIYDSIFLLYFLHKKTPVKYFCNKIDEDDDAIEQTIRLSYQIPPVN